MHENYDDRRKAPRAALNDTLFIESISSSQVASVGTDVKTGNTVNVSAYGMQVMLDFEVLVDSELALWVVQEDTNERILVNGIVRWTSKIATENKYLVGIELHQDASETMEKWIQKRADFNG